MLADTEDIMRATCAALGAELVEFNAEADHVHLLIDYPPTLAIADLVPRLKGASARRLRADHTGRCDRAPMHGHFWTPSYFVVSCGGAPLAIIKQYIENQARPLRRPPAHHAKHG